MFHVVFLSDVSPIYRTLANHVYRHYQYMISGIIGSHETSDYVSNMETTYLEVYRGEFEERYLSLARHAYTNTISV